VRVVKSVLFGQDKRFDSLTILSLDRVVSITGTPSPYIQNTQYDFNEYFEDMIGITKPLNGVVATVVLLFSKSQTPYIITKPLHCTQKHTMHDAGSSIVRIEVIPNYELEQTILGFGEHCRVLEPQDLSIKISERLEHASQNYQLAD